MKTSNIILWLSIILLAFSSCEKTITMSLDGVKSELVIDATLTNQEGAGACKVSLHKTIDYFKTNSFVPVENATIMLSDEDGNTELLYEESSGIYISSVLYGVPGREYTLKVTVDGNVYSATSHMKRAIEIDSLTYRYNDILFGPYEDEGYLIDCHYDADGNDDFIALFVKKNGKQSDEIYFSNGLFDFQIEDVFQIDDHAEVELRNFTEDMYHYFETVNKISGADGNPLAGGTPINPISNFSNGALGCFAVYPVSVVEVVIEE